MRKAQCAVCGQTFPVSRTTSSAPAATCTGINPYAETVTGDDAGGSDASNVKHPQKIGRFILERELGSGAFGTVYRAHDPQLDRPVAIKLLKFAPDSEERIARFLAEAKAAAQLHHPNIVALYENGEFEGQHYIVAEFVDGHPLSAIISDATYDYQKCVQWIRDVSRALSYAHDQGVIHRDIKPANIMLDVQSKPRLMDFGLAKRIDHDSSMTTDGLVLGTPAYMPPEQARAEHDIVGPRADQYSMGAVLYELLTRQKPFDGSMHAVLAYKAGNQLPPSIHSVAPDVPKDVVAICEKAMQVSPDDRYESVRDFAEDLDRYLKGRPIQARFAGPIERTIKWVRREPLVGGLSVAVAIVTVVGLLATSLSLVHALRSRSEAIASRQTAEEKQEAFAEQRDTAEQLRKLATKREQQSEANRREAEAIARVAEDRLEEVKKRSEQLQMARDQESAAREQAEAESLARLQAVEREKQALEETRLTALRSQVLSDMERGNAICEQGRGAEGLHYMLRAWNAIPAGDRDQLADMTDALRQGIAVQQKRLASLTAIYPSDALESREGISEIKERSGPLPFSQLDDRSNGNRTRRAAWRTEVRAEQIVDPQDGKRKSIPVPTTTVIVRDLLLDKIYAAKELKHLDAVDVALTADTSRLAVIGRHTFGQNIVAVYQIQRQRCDLIESRFIPGVRLRDVAFGPKGETLLLSAGTEVAMLDARSLQPVHPPMRFPGNVHFVTGTVQGGHRLAVFAERTVWLVDLANRGGRISCQHDGRVVHGAFSPDGTEFVSCSEDGTTQIWNVQTGEPVCLPIVHVSAMKQAVFLESGDEILTVTEDDTPQIWRLPGRHKLNDGNTAIGGARTATFDGDGRRLLTIARTAAVIYSVSEQRLEPIRRIELREGFRGGGFLVGGFLAAGAQFYVLQDPGGLSVYSSQDGAGHPGRRTPTFGEGDHFVFESPDFDGLLAISGRNMTYYDRQRRESSPVLEFPQDILAGAQSRDRRHIAVSLADGHVRIYSLAEDARKPELTQTITVQPPATALALDRQSMRLAVGRGDGVAQVWDLGTGDPLSAPLMTGARRPCESIRILTDGRVAATTSSELRVWHYPTGVLVAQRRQQSTATTPIAICASSSQVLIDGRLRPLFEADDDDESHEPILTRDGLTLMTGLELTDDGQVQCLTREQWSELRSKVQANIPEQDTEGDK
ncbi:WD40 repeat domain-containing serine/threonine-protein kinase [Maioricimonas rarisocia]|nr:WD40 repeat domain-containing serine/threonine-protein kinase [Maioricimonas rarisocia]